MVQASLASHAPKGHDCRLVSHPSVARPSDDTVPTEPKAKVCPRCLDRWPEDAAPTTCPTDGAALVSPRELVADHDPMVGRTLEGRYTILAKLGAGSMGTVYRAKQHAMGRDVAIKILRGDRAIDDTAKARFMREARANSLLASPNTVTVFDFGQSESGEFYLAMELLEGESLGERIARVGRLPAAVAVDTCRQALRSLGEAHAKGIIHRDLKPDNLFFARVLTSTKSSSAGDGKAHDEIVKVLDFGIAKMVDADGPMGVVETQAGTVFGTPRYMSPEQAQGRTLDARSDLYSLAVILYQMLTGRPPFTDNDAVVVMARHIKSTPKRPNEAVPDARVPAELEDVVMRTLSKSPNDRPASAEVLASELLAALDGHGAQASGVRSAITHADSLRVRRSRRPALLRPVLDRRGFATVVAASLGLLVIVGGVYWATTRRTEPVRGATPTAGATAMTTTGANVATTDPPTVTPDSLPAAPPSASGASSSAKAVRSPPGHPAVRAAPRPSSGVPAIRETPQYGIFE